MTEQTQSLPPPCGSYQYRRHHGYGRRSRNPAVAVTRSFFLPTLLFALTINLGMAIQTGMLVGELRELKIARAKLDGAATNTAKLRASLDKVVTACAKAGIQDNANAKLIIDELAKHGITMTTVVFTSKT